MRKIINLSQHTVLSLSILLVYGAVIALNKSLILTAAIAALIISTVGHSLLHFKTGRLKRDILVEYLIVLLMGVLLIFGVKQ